MKQQLISFASLQISFVENAINIVFMSSDLIIHETPSIEDSGRISHLNEIKWTYHEVLYPRDSNSRSLVNSIERDFNDPSRERDLSGPSTPSSGCQIFYPDGSGWTYTEGLAPDIAGLPIIGTGWSIGGYMGASAVMRRTFLSAL